MSVAIDILNPEKPKHVAIVASNPGVSKQTGWPIGFWWSELAHPYWEFVEHGYKVDIFSPEGGKLEADSWSDPRDDSKYSADDLISLGFINSPMHMPLVEKSKPVNQITVSAFDAILFVGGQGPMYTFYEDKRVYEKAIVDRCYGELLARWQEQLADSTTYLRDNCWAMMESVIVTLPPEAN